MSGIELVPAKPGYFPVFSSTKWVIQAVSGSQATPANVNAGSDGAHSNFFASQASPSNANVNASVPTSIIGGPTAAANTVKRILNAPVIMDITSGAQGTGLVLRASLLVWVIWLTASQ